LYNNQRCTLIKAKSRSSRRCPLWLQARRGGHHSRILLDVALPHTPKNRPALRSGYADLPLKNVPNIEKRMPPSMKSASRDCQQLPKMGSWSK